MHEQSGNKIVKVTQLAHAHIKHSRLRACSAGLPKFEMPKHAKKKIWEKERRDHLKEAFLRLEKLLPSYDPSNTASKIDVLTKSIEYIQEMKNLIHELSKSKSEINPKVLKLKNLQDRIKRLLSRMEILSRLLREAKIPIPNARSWKEFKQKKNKWSGKIDASKDLVSNAKLSKNSTSDEKLENNQIGSGEVKGVSITSILPKTRKIATKKIRSDVRPLQPSGSNCLLIYTQAYNTSPCYFVATNTSSNLTASSQTVVTNSMQLSNPRMTATVKGGLNSSVQTNSKIQSIGGGSLILSNGNIYPVLQQSQPILPTPMLIQVTDKSNNNNKKDTNTEPKNCKERNKKKLISKKEKKETNSTVKNSVPPINIKPSPSILPAGRNIALKKNSVLFQTQFNPVIFPASNTLKPKTISTGITKKKAVGRRLGDKPVSRQVLKRIKKLATAKELEEKEKNVAKSIDKNSSSNVNSEVSEKKSSSPVDSNAVKTDDVKTLEMKNNECSTHISKVDDSKSKTNISIISDDIIKTPDASSVITINSEDAAGKIVQDHQPVQSYVDEQLKKREEEKVLEICTEKQENSNSEKLDRNKPYSESPESKEKILNEEQKKSEPIEKPNNCVPNTEQNIHTENNANLENDCNVNNDLKNLDIHLGHSELSNDIFASLQVPTGCQNPESTSPTAAFLLAFPLVSSLTGVKVTEVMDEDNPDSQRETPTLLQIGTMDNTKSAQSESFHSNLLNLDFFSSKDIYNGFYSSFEHLSTMLPSNNMNESLKIAEKGGENSKFGSSYKGSNEMENIQTCSSKQTSINDQIVSSVSDIQNNEVFSSSLDCQSKFGYVEKQSDIAATCQENKACNISSEIYLHDSIGESAPGKETLNKNENTEENSANFQSDLEYIKNAKNKSSTSKIPTSNSFLKINTCDNIFNSSHEANNDSNTLKNFEPVGMTYFSEKQKLLIPDHYSVQNESAKGENTSSLYRHTSNTQVGLENRKNCVSLAMNHIQAGPTFEISTSFASKDVHEKDSNFNVPKQVDSSGKAAIQPYLMLNNKNYQEISHQAGTKSSSVEIRNTVTQKCFNYDNFISDSKKSGKNTEIFENKDMASNYNISYSNSIYDINNITKISTCAYSTNKPASEPLYTNSNNHSYNYYSNSNSYMNECYKQLKNDKNHVSEPEIYTNTCKKADFQNDYYSESMKKNVISSKCENVEEKSTYNWMTTPIKSTNNIIPNLQKEDSIFSNNLINNNQNSYFNPSSTFPTELNANLNQAQKKPFDLPVANINYQKGDMEDQPNQFSWSPTKMPQFLDPVPSFVTSTLPTLVGDLALGSSNFLDQKYDFTNKPSMKNRVNSKVNYENQSNFFSVSQLVHDKNVPGKPTRRRNSGSKNHQIKNKKVIKTSEDHKEISQCFNKGLLKIEHKNYHYKQTGNVVGEKKVPAKGSSSIYSAEALISQHGLSENNARKDQTFSGNNMKNISVPPYIHENIMPYFPPVDLQPDNIMQQNQNFQNFHNFTTFSNNTYSTNTFIPTSTITTPYMSSTTFASDLGTANDISSENLSIFPNTHIGKIKMPSKNRDEKTIPSVNIGNKKVKRKPTNEAGITSNIDFPFLSVPGNIHSPILPEDFHTHSTYLPPPPTQSQLYPCKNTFYPTKQSTITSTAPLLPLPPIPSITRSGLQHPDVSPSSNTVGTSSLTNFNLSTIFPEINKSSMNDIYSETQAKDQDANRHYSNSSVSFNPKPPFNYPNCSIPQPYGIDNR